jgi:hypothetical protein
MTILDRDRKILWARSHNRCAICRTRLVADASDVDREAVVGDEAHIIASSSVGPRGTAAPTFNIDSYENLILLCKIDHKIVDDQPRAFTPDVLRKIKLDHERWAESMFDGHDTTDISEGITEVGKRVPRSKLELRELRRRMPGGWEYLLFASMLALGVEDLAPARLDSRAGWRTPGKVLGSSTTARQFIQESMRRGTNHIANLSGWFRPEILELAFGKPGEPGDVRLIEHVAKRLLNFYSGLMDWTHEFRSTVPPTEFEEVFELCSQIVEPSLQAFESFVTQLVQQCDRIPSHLIKDEGRTLSVTVTLDLPSNERLVDLISKKLRRLP